MKQLLFTIAATLCGVSAYAFTHELKSIKLEDGIPIQTRLCLPEGEVRTVVIAVHGTGANTYLNRRPTFNYYDDLAQGFCERGVAFFTYNRRGCSLGNTPPLYVDIDSVQYARYTPLQEARDVETMVRSIKNDKRFRHCKIILYGISEGTIIAPLVAERGNIQVDALLLHGYAHENMFDIIRWQNEGHGVMIIANSILDRDNDNRISKAEYEDSDEKRTKQRGALFQNLPFETLDVVKDGFISIEDIRQMRKPFHEYLLKCISENNYQWIRSNFFNVTPQWFKAHFALEANKTRLLRLDIPIHIFHGTDDASVPVENVEDLKVRFDACNKSNLHINIFEGHNHDLNFQDWLSLKAWPVGLKSLFNTAAL